MNQTSIHEDVGSIPSLIWWVSIAVNCGVGHRHGLDPSLFWLWTSSGKPKLAPNLEKTKKKKFPKKKKKKKKKTIK